MGVRNGEVTGEWRRLYKEDLYDLYSSPNTIWMIKSRRVRWAVLVACIGDRRGAKKVLMGRSEGKRPLGMHRLIWEYIFFENRVLRKIFGSKKW